MRKFLVISACILMTGLLFQSCKKSDENIQKDVNKTLTENNFSMISSTVKDGTVTLVGTVDSQQQKSEVENKVRDVKDVKGVVSNVVVKEATPQVVVNPDQTIKSTIDSKLSTAGYKDVKVEVKDGEVILTGDLKRADLTKVMQIANESNPKSVKNELKLK